MNLFAYLDLCSGIGPAQAPPALSRPHKVFSRNFYLKNSAQSHFPGHSSSLMILDINDKWVGRLYTFHTSVYAVNM